MESVLVVRCVIAPIQSLTAASDSWSDLSDVKKDTNALRIAFERNVIFMSMCSLSDEDVVAATRWKIFTTNVIFVTQIVDVL